MHRTHVCIGLAAAGLLTASAWPVGPEWTEVGDAGSLPGAAQTPQGNGPLGKITGGLVGDGLFAGGDYQDMYLIFISDPEQFSVSLDPADGGSADFNTQLFLFDSAGRGILANDDISSSNLLSAFGNAANDGSDVVVTVPGVYLIAISGFNSDPFSQGDQLIFDQQTTTEISGPDGPGGDHFILGWNGAGDTGSYSISLSGVSFAPAPGTGALLVVAAGLARRRRRRA